MTGYFSYLKADGLAVAEGPTDGPAQPLFTGEEASIAKAVPKRRQEFSIARSLARKAMTELGFPQTAVPARPDRSPQWPPGLTGSITHTGDWCAVAIGTAASGILSLGIDLEPLAPLPEDLVAAICSDDELRQLNSKPAAMQSIFARAIFSAKESIYKAQYPLSGRFLDMNDVGVNLDEERGRFTGSLITSAAPFKPGHIFYGQLRLTGRHIATSVILSQSIT